VSLARFRPKQCSYKVDRRAAFSPFLSPFFTYLLVMNLVSLEGWKLEVALAALIDSIIGRQ
jgi:hypothetical protein